MKIQTSSIKAAIAKERAYRHNIGDRSNRKACVKTTRRVPKSELRYRILENTMRGYFNYSI